jgi:hypothetical protein
MSGLALRQAIQTLADDHDVTRADARPAGTLWSSLIAVLPVGMPSYT